MRQAEERLGPEPCRQRHDDRCKDREAEEDRTEFVADVMRLRLRPLAPDREKRHDRGHPDEPEQDAGAAEFEDQERAAEVEGSEFGGEAEGGHGIAFSTECDGCFRPLCGH